MSVSVCSACDGVEFHVLHCVVCGRGPAGERIPVGQVTFAPRLESQAVIGDKVFDMHTHEPVDLLALPYKLAIRNLRRELLVHAREHRAGWDPSRGYTEGLRYAARRLRQLLR